MKKLSKLLAIVLSLTMLITASATLIGCGPGTEKDTNEYTFNTYTAVSPSNWNQLTYQDNNDLQILNYINSDLFSYNYKYNGTHIAANIVAGEFEIEYEMATKLEDVSEEYDLDKYMAYKITLRDNLQWENGDPITAASYVYSMKEQLNPLFQNYRADSYYTGATILRNAKEYVYQGKTDWFKGGLIYKLIDNADPTALIYEIADSQAKTKSAITVWGSLKSYADAGYLAPYTYADIQSLNGKTYAEILDNAEYLAILEALWDLWVEVDSEKLDCFITEYTFPEMSFDEVGIFVGSNPNEIVLILENALDLIDEHGNLTFKAAYNMANLPLVHESTYEDCKRAPQAGSTLWTSVYNSSKATTMAFGPYKLTNFQAGKQYILSKNDKWFGYNLSQYAGQFQTTRIVCETIAEWNTAWLKFLAGNLDSITIDVSVADEYKNSSRAYFTPDDFVSSLQLQSNSEALKDRETLGIDKEILTYVDFRMGLSMALDRADFANKTTTSSLAGFGLFNSMHYYDVANGGVYRNTDEAKKVLCDIYGIDVAAFGGDLDAAVESITGYNPTLAKEKITAAYNQALIDGKISAADKVQLVYGTSVDNTSVRRSYNYLNDAWKKIMIGTPLEGRFELVFDASFGTQWANDFKAGKYDICAGGWTGAAWDPGYFLLAYLDANYMYSKGWDTGAAMMEFTMEGVSYEMIGKQLTQAQIDAGVLVTDDISDNLSLLDWYGCLNGLSGCKYNLSATTISNELRLQLIAALEYEVLKVYYSIPVANRFLASLNGYKSNMYTTTYNTFMAYGGLRYRTYNYTDVQWKAYLQTNLVNGQLDYKK